MSKLRILIQGACGKMGRAVIEAAAVQPDCSVVGGVDVRHGELPVPYFPSLWDAPPADVLVDFSAPGALAEALAWCRASKTPLVLCTTGHSPAQQAEIAALSQEVPVFQSANLSPGIAVLAKLAGEAARLLPDYDVELVERHHREKKDAPSGTALLLARACGRERAVYGRGPGGSVRQPGEIGIHAVRGGTIFGDHELLFAGPGETLTLTHRAESRDLFARGALRAACFLQAKPAGLYHMEDLI